MSQSPSMPDRQDAASSGESPSVPGAVVSRLNTLLDRVWVYELSHDDASELAAILNKHPELKIKYVETVHALSSVSSWSRVQHNSSLTALKEITAAAMNDPNRRTELPSASPRSGVVWRRYVTACAIASVVLIAVLLRNRDQPSDAPANPTEVQAAVTPGDREDTVNEVYVAQITGITPDGRLSNTSQPDFLLRLRRGEPLTIERGLAEIEYFSGATLILHGPATFIPTGSQSGRLVSGRISGEVSKGDFTLRTPSADVIDLGTAFGVSVDDSNNTEVIVFDGKVRVSAAGDLASHGKSMHLTEGMAARIANNGAIRQDAEVTSDRFTRDFPHQPLHTSEISLADLLSGPGGDGRCLAGVLDPTTGDRDQQPWLRSIGPGDRTGDDLYHATDWHPAIDGVFIPSKSGRGVQIDSTGRHVDLPANLGATWGPIWSRRKLDGPFVYSKEVDYWGTDTFAALLQRLDLAKAGIIGVHSNVGVTFDLQAIRRQSGIDFGRFRAAVSNLTIATERVAALGGTALAPRYSADFRVYVDGSLRHERLDFSGEDGEQSINVELTPSDRYLTMVTTDSNGDNAFDHVVLVDPELVAVP